MTIHDIIKQLKHKSIKEIIDNKVILIKKDGTPIDVTNLSSGAILNLIEEHYDFSKN